MLIKRNTFYRLPPVPSVSARPARGAPSECMLRYVETAVNVSEKGRRLSG